ncbi:hypothetical protein [Bacteroides difficilis]|uniref:hypothetical protein n=1 Tax=Bacteroides difficilis TaxID=2763021 RepID=UPI003AAB7793
MKVKLLCTMLLLGWFMTSCSNNEDESNDERVLDENDVPGGDESPDDQKNEYVWDGSYPTDIVMAKKWLGNPSIFDTDGSKCVFVINSVKQLTALHILVCNKAKIDNTHDYMFPYYVNATYKLSTDLDLNGKEWTPIGWNSAVGDEWTSFFSGRFDGQGHRITGLNISMDMGDCSLSKAYLGFLSSWSNVNNLRVEGDISISNYKGLYLNVGGVVGMSSNCSFCSFEGHIQLKNCMYDKAVPEKSQQRNVGGILGENRGGDHIRACFADVTIQGENIDKNNRWGGILGEDHYSIVDKLEPHVYGCTWYYDEINQKGYKQCYSGWNQTAFFQKYENASFCNVSELDERVGIMNNHAKGEDEYRWSMDGTLLKLVKL